MEQVESAACSSTCGCEQRLGARLEHLETQVTLLLGQPQAAALPGDSSGSPPTSWREQVQSSIEASERRLDLVLAASEESLTRHMAQVVQDQVSQVTALVELVQQQLLQLSQDSSSVVAHVDSTASLGIDEIKQLVHESVAKSEERVLASAQRSARRRKSSLYSMQSVSALDFPAHIAPVKTAETYEDAFNDIGGLHVLEQFRQQSENTKNAASDKALANLVDNVLSGDPTSRSAYSTGPVYQHFTESCDSLFVQARDLKTSFEDRVLKIAEKTNGFAVLPPIKSKKRAQMKARFKYKGPCDTIAWYRLTDLLRATVSYPDIPSMYNGLEALLLEFDGEVREFNDRYFKPLPGGYRDLQMVVEHRGHMCELQLSTNAMIATKESAGHRDYDVRRELVQAVTQGDVELIKDTLSWGASHLGGDESRLNEVLNVKHEKTGITVLHEAAAVGNADMVYQLLVRKADANIQDKHGNTALHIALEGGFDQAAWCLLDLGKVDWSIQNKKGSPALLTGMLSLRQRPDDENAARAVCTLSYQAGSKHVSEVLDRVDEALSKRLHNSTTLVLSAADGDTEKMDAELRQFADPNSKDQESRVALVAAAKFGKVEAVRLLLKLKADVASHGKQALDVALAERYKDVVDELLKAGAGVPTSGDLLLSFIGGATDQEYKFAGACLGPDNKIYCCPFDAAHVLVVDPVTRKLEIIEGVGEGERKYFGICVGPDSKMYCAPHHAKNVLVINPNPERGTTKKLSFIEGPALDGTRKYAGIAMGGDGKLYCSPRHASDILVIDPFTTENQLSYIAGPVEPKVTEFKYSGICKGPGLDGKLYCAPQCAPDVMVIDPAAREVSFIMGEGLDPDRPFKYSDICVGPDSKLYCSPFGADSILVVDPKERTFSNIGAITPGHSQFSSICAGPGNKLFCCPENAPYVLIVKPDTGELEFITGNGMENEKKYLGICAGPDNCKLYCAPFNNDSVMEVEPRPVVDIAQECGGAGLVEAFKEAEIYRKPGESQFGSWTPWP